MIAVLLSLASAISSFSLYKTSVFRSLPMPLLTGGELARRMVDRLYVATTIKEAHLCKVALRSLVEADTECSAFAKQAEEPILKRWTRKTPSRWPDNSAGRRQEARRAARAPAQGVPNVREEN